MQTFLPYPDFTKSADCLDWQRKFNRLNNQIDEGITIARVLLGLYPKTPKSTHPAIKMWEGYGFSLVQYTYACLCTWERKKGIVDANRRQTLIYFQSFMGWESEREPFWLGDEKFHSAHRAILLAKDPKWYSQFGWTEEPAVRNEKGKWPYYWPV